MWKGYSVIQKIPVTAVCAIIVAITRDISLASAITKHSLLKHQEVTEYSLCNRWSSSRRQSWSTQIAELPFAREVTQRPLQDLSWTRGTVKVEKSLKKYETELKIRWKTIEIVRIFFAQVENSPKVESPCVYDPVIVILYFTFSPCSNH